MKTTLFLLFCLLFTLVFTALYACKSWNELTEGTYVYRLTGSYKDYRVYRIVILSQDKYLVNVGKEEPYIKYDFKTFLLDWLNNRIFTEGDFDHFD